MKKAPGKVYYGLTKEEQQSKIFRRSLFAVEDIGVGEFFMEENVKSIRLAYGLKPKYIARILGKKAKRDINKRTPLGWDLIVS